MRSIVHSAGRAAAAAAATAAVALFAAACGRGTPPPEARAPLEDTVESGPVRITIAVDPPAVDLARDNLLTIRVSAPTGCVVRVPPLADRLSGFTLSGEFDTPASDRNDRRVFERHARLTPLAHPEHRLAPIPLSYSAAGRRPAGWLATRPLLVPRAAEPMPPSRPADIRGIVRVLPPFRTVALGAAGLALAVTLGALLWKYGRRIRRRIEILRMSPRERALRELSDLLALGLVEQGRVKDFYFTLTMIVRRYIERAHRIRAPEQTSEEFLDAVGRDPRFGPPVVARLRSFVEAADLVKYAAFQPDGPVVTQAVDTARTYIETDSADAAAREGRRV